MRARAQKIGHQQGVVSGGKLLSWPFHYHIGLGHAPYYPKVINNFGKWFKNNVCVNENLVENLLLEGRRPESWIAQAVRPG